METAKGAPLQPGTARAAQVRGQLDRILSSPGFQGANRRTRLLRFLVEETLDDRTDSLKESVIAAAVFERAPDYDPQVDSVVRVEVGRLRSRLTEYYGQAGPNEPVRIEIPKGGYRPVFIFRETLPEAGPEVAEPHLELEPTPAFGTRQTPSPVQTPIPPETRAAPAPPRRNWKFDAAIAIALAVVACVFWWTRISTSANPTSIAVLPFLNLSGDPSNEYLGDGISEEVTEALSQSPGLRVVARTSAFQYKGKAADVREIGQKLGAGAILEGSVSRRGETLHVVAQLIRARDGYHLWSQIYDGGASELPTAEAQIAQAVNTKLNPSGPATAQKTATAKDPEAHDLYLRAAYEFSRLTTDSVRRAIDLAGQAAEKDPSYAQPYILIAKCDSVLTTFLVQTPREAAERERRSITKALELDPSNSAALAQKAMVDYTDGWDWPQAEREFRLALAQGSHGSVENNYGWCLMTRGRFAEARRHLQIAAELDPLSLGPQLNQVEEMIAEHNLQEAKRKAEGLARIAPNNFVALSLMSAIAFYQHDCPGSTEWNQKLLQQYPQVPHAHLSALGTDVACGHDERQTTAKFQEILHGHPPGFISPHFLAAIYADLGYPDEAMSLLEKSAQFREPTLLYLKIEGAFDKMRQDPRLVALKRRMGLLD